LVATPLTRLHLRLEQLQGHLQGMHSIVVHSHLLDLGNRNFKVSKAPRT
jgi:hypothetical protein